MCPFQWFSWEDDGWLKIKKFSPNIIIGENIEIFMWELNKVHDIGVQSLSDKENKKSGLESIEIIHKG